MCGSRADPATRQCFAKIVASQDWHRLGSGSLRGRSQEVGQEGRIILIQHHLDGFKKVREESQLFLMSSIRMVVCTAFQVRVVSMPSCEVFRAS